MSKRTKTPTDNSTADVELERQLDEIRAEETPDRLLQLARTLQNLLRQRQQPH